MNFIAFFNPSTTLGAFLISVVASLVVGFISGRKYENHTNTKTIMKNVQKNKNAHGDIYQGCTINNDKQNEKQKDEQED